MRILKLDKIITQGTSYRTHRRAALEILEIGTDTTTASRLLIDNKQTGDIIEDVAPLHYENTKINGLLDISKLPYVVLPDTDFEVSGGSGANFHIRGKLYQLDSGEAVPAHLTGRYEQQFNHYYKYVTDTYSFATDASWADGTEIELYSLTPATIEKYIFNNLVMIDYSNLTVNPGDIVVQFYIDNNPLEFLESTNLDRGIDLLSIPHQDDVSVNLEPFTLKDYPIELLGDHTLKVTAKNVSGSAKSPPSGTAISLTFYAVCEYHREA